MTIDSHFLERLGVRQDRADEYGPQFAEVLPQHAINTPLREAHFVAQVLHESSMCRATKENLNYSADALERVFGKYFPTGTLAEEYERQPQRIGARVYANRMGNGDEASGDGYHYRGRGLIQLTGKDNYGALAAWLDEDVVTDPVQVAEVYAVASAVFFWDKNRLNRFADADDLRGLTRAINGGYNGLAHRQTLLDQAKGLLGLTGAAPTATTGDIYNVVPNALHLRSAPELANGNVVSALARGQQVQRLDKSAPAGWMHVRVPDEGAEGYVAARYLLLAV